MLKICAWCGKEFSPKHGNSKYCSSECQKEVRRETDRKYYREHKRTQRIKARKCKWCGNEFFPKHGQCKYCSPKCQKEAKRETDRKAQRKYYWKNKKIEIEKRRKKIDSRKCEWCGKEFSPKHSNSKYCSPECRKNAENERSRCWYHLHKPGLEECILEHDNCFSCPTPDGECLFD